MAMKVQGGKMVPARASEAKPSPQQAQALMRHIDSAQDALQRFFDAARTIPGMSGPRANAAVKNVYSATTELVRAEMALKGEL